MADANATDTTPVPPATASGNSFLKRELNGATFLSLEHAGHMALVVVIACLIATGIVAAISLWTGSSSVLNAMSGTSALSSMVGAGATKYIESAWAIVIVAALLVLIPMLIVLDRRTRAEWLKRPGYTGRLAYKVPVYIALGVLIVAKTIAVIQMVGVVLTSLALIGVSNAGIGQMYLYQFLPAAIAATIFGATAWYLFKLAKGRDNGRMFSMLVAVVGAALAIALFITAVVNLHSSATPVSPVPSNDYFNSGGSSSKDLQDIFRY